jgi:MurNAc alpha-1-phosphate uridylyltransferase
VLTVGVLCGGKGTRVADVAGLLPKALIPIAGEPFLAHQLRWLARAGTADVVLLTGYRAQAIRNFVGDGTAFGLRVRYSDDGNQPRGTAGAIRQALPALGERFIVVYGDSLTPVELTPVAHSLLAPFEGVMTVFHNADRWLRSNVRVEHDRIVAYDKHAPLGEMTHLDYGINAFFSSAFASVAPDGPADLAEIHRAMIARGTLRAFPVSQRWYEIGSREGIADTERFILSQSKGQAPQ